MCLGQQRFRILDYVREKPYRVGLVEWIEDEKGERNLRSLGAEVRTLLEDVVNLSSKLADQTIDLPAGYP